MAVDSQLTRYRDLATIGRGGMASVVLAEDTVLGRRVALKRMHPSAADRRAILRLRREALVGASMSHANLVSIYDVIDCEDGSAVIVMEFVEGETLREALTREGRMAPKDALRVLRGVATALDAIHRRGIVHRDVKPANVLLGSDGRVKLADLGIASVADDTRITTAGTVLGSFRYMAPEQLKDGPARQAVDIYALAAVAFETLSGRQARREDNPLAVAHAISTQPPPDLRGVWPEAPARAAEVLMRGMCRDPAGRPASAGALVAELADAFKPRERIPPATARTVALAPRRAEPPSVQRPVAAPAPQARRPMAVPPAQARRPVAGPPPKERRLPAAPPPKARPNETVTARRSGWARLLVPLVLLLALGGVALAVSTSGDPTSTATHPPPSTRAKRHTPKNATGSRTSTSSSSTTTASAPAATASAPASTASAPAATPTPSAASREGTAAAANSPVSAVESFYHLAAAHRYSEAWALADSTFRGQLGGYNSFAAGQAADRSITFNGARVVRQSNGAATVSVQTTSVRTTGTQHCAGTVQLVPGSSGGWLLHLISISCT